MVWKFRVLTVGLIYVLLIVLEINICYFCLHYSQAIVLTKVQFISWEVAWIQAFTTVICALLGYCAAQSGNFLPTFQGDLSVPSSRVKKTKKKKMQHLDEIRATLAVLWLRPLMAGLSPWISLLGPWAVQLIFMVNRVAVRQVYLSSTAVFPCQCHSTKALLHLKSTFIRRSGVLCRRGDDSDRMYLGCCSIRALTRIRCLEGTRERRRLCRVTSTGFCW